MTKPTDKIEIRVSNLAAAKLHLLLYQERQKTDKPLGVRVIPLTSGCNTPSFALELSECRPDDLTKVTKEVPFLWRREESDWMNGLTIDLNRENGKFSIYHPHPPHLNDCPF